MKLILTTMLTLLLLINCPAFAEDPAPKYLLTKEALEKLTPDEALAKLKAGNERFATEQMRKYDWKAIAKYSAKGQYPMAIALACIDSRSAPTDTFDQGLGNVFAARTAGNVVDKDVLGGMEFATKFIGSKLIVVMGHTSCGAVVGACSNVKSGNLTQLLAKMQPAVSVVKTKEKKDFSCNDPKTIDDITKQNVLNQMKNILKQSPTISTLIKENKIKMVGAMHDLSTRKVVFFDIDGNAI